MMMTFMEVKGQRGQVTLYGYQTWPKEPLMQVYDDDDERHGGQRSTEVKYSKLCPMATKLGQVNRRCKFKMIMEVSSDVLHQM